MNKPTPFDAEQHAGQANYSIDFTDWSIASLEARVSGLEELVAARWPRSMFVRRRLARELRASSATFAWAGDTFARRRSEAIGEQLIEQ